MTRDGPSARLLRLVYPARMDEELMRRIRALEKGVRWSKILIFILALVVAGLGVGVRVLMREDVQYRRVAMRELVVIDADGRERLVGSVDAQGAVGLSWRSPEGTTQVVASASAAHWQRSSVWAPQSRSFAPESKS